MSRWTRKTQAEKERISVDQSSKAPYPTNVEALKKKLDPMSIHVQRDYLWDWIDHHKKTGKLDKEGLLAFAKQLVADERLENLAKLPYFKNRNIGSYVADMATSPMFRNTPMQKEANQALIEILGPSSFNGTGDYEPTWERHPRVIALKKELEDR